ncbi:MAG: MerR family transcriptional regulator [Spirochaetae bacterium HGW-Spirochaetae-4]|nr:MAG: MerR family transcriptional regulator [Spirochaetae bacterium HGW-Spirochaetae-4]HCS37734.1 MerR family transcriptional regulator [Sphaerochaeta sp.]
MKEVFSIGEFSKLFKIDVQTLRYYDSIDLMVPAFRDSTTGYRSYRFDQVYQFAKIRYLRQLGCSLDQIRDCVHARDIGTSMQVLREQSEQLRKQWEHLIKIDSVIQRKLSFVEQSLASLEIGFMGVKTFPERYYIPIGSEETLYASEEFYFYPTLVFYCGEEKIFGSYLHDWSEQELRDGRTRSIRFETIPAGDYFCAYHTGPYHLMHETFERMRTNAGELVLGSVPLDMNIIDQFVERDSNKYITEVQIPILG